MALNYILSILIIAGIVALGFWYFKKTDLADTMEEYNEFLTIESLSKLVVQAFAITMSRSINEMNLSQEEYNKISSEKEEIKTNLRTAPYGDRQAKRFVLSFHKDIIQNERIGKITHYNADKVIPFDVPELIKSRDKTELLIFLWLQEGKKGFSKNFCKFKLDRPRETAYGDSYCVTTKDIERVFAEYMELHGPLSYQEKIDFISQRAYEDTYGSGAVDLLLETDIDEVQGGVSGIPYNSYEVEVENPEDINYSFESIWIVFKGKLIHLECTTFGTQTELIRVTRNICRYNAPAILTKKDAAIIGSMKNGNRVTAFCPEFADSYGFFARKFDSAPSIEPEKLLL